MIIFRLIGDSVKFALNSLVINKLRTVLSLLGITIGIFSIISVMTTIDSLERSIRDNVSSLGDNKIYIQKWPWSFGKDYPWWKYMNRPLPNLDETEKIKQQSIYSESVAFAASTSKTAEYEDKYVENAGVMLLSHDYDQVQAIDIEKGRYFSQLESNNGKNVAVIGAVIAESLFGELNPIDKKIKIAGRKISIIGVCKKEGEDMFNSSMDEVIMIPVNFGKNIFDIESDALNPFIIVKAKENVSAEQLVDELTIIMRTIRRLKPMEEDNFALNQASMISKGLDSIFKILDIAGIIIGGFAILVGGFGIANIMFVSVKERTKEIGIQKAIGAKSYLILIQFLTEASVLSLVGGIVGLILVWLLTLVASSMTPLHFALSFGNILSGTLISIVIGVVSGYAPARKAAKLDPVTAMNFV
ncbi:MAG: ABC transporter permease [Bacteroidales bacterium]|nr:ABC transporter permease [Bacteroidales bacterium]